MKKRCKIPALLLAGFLLVAGVGCEKEGEDLVMYAPDGAPALAIAKLLFEDTREDGIEYRIVAPTLISSKVTNKQAGKNADFCVLPVTAASKLLGTGVEYQALGTVTHGNLYLLAKEKGFDDLTSLVGKKVGVLQINEVPGLTLKATLNKRGVAWQELQNGGTVSETKVNLVAISAPTAVGTIEADYYLIAEPAASAQKQKGYSIVGDLQALYNGEEGYPQAVLVAKKSLIEERKQFVEELVERVKGAPEFLANASGEQLVSLVSSHLEDEGATTSLKAPLLTAEVTARCGIYFTYAATGAAEMEEFLSALIEVNDRAAAIPSQNFYWKR